MKQVDYWYRHSKRITAALWLTGIFFISGVTAIVSWIVLSALSKEAESLGERVRALRPVSPNGEGDVSPEVSAMNRQVGAIADEVEVIYAELLDSRPLAPRVCSVISYSLTIAMLVFIWIVSG